MRAPIHFINCHGGPTDPNYYGDEPEFPDAHLPANIAGIVAKGAVVVAECCYGGEIYSPPKGVAVGLANTYLSQGAIAYCGATNTAYGDATAATRCAADILCTDYMSAVMKRASTGRALLEARQAFVKSEGADVIDPVDQKTLGQFLLLGDPSLRPFGAGLAPEKVVGLSKSIVAAAGPGGMKRGGAKSKAKANAKALSPHEHRARRDYLKKEGAALSRSTPCAQKAAGATPAAVQDSLAKVMAKEGLAPGRTTRYAVAVPQHAGSKAKSFGAMRVRGPKAKVRGMKANGAGANSGDAVHVMLAPASNGAAGPTPKGAKGLRRARALVRGKVRRSKPKIAVFRGLVARTRDGQVLSYKPVWSK